MKTTARSLIVPALTLALVGAATPAALAAPSANPTASTTTPAATATAARTATTAAKLTVAAPRTSTVEEAVTRSGARRMRTTATWYPSEQRVVAVTRTSNTVKLTGFTGGAQVVFLDQHGRVLGFTGVRTFGVDGTWVEAVPDAPWLARATSIRVVHTHASQNRLNDIVARAAVTAMQIAELVTKLNGLKPAN